MDMQVLGQGTNELGERAFTVGLRSGRDVWDLTIVENHHGKLRCMQHNYTWCEHLAAVKDHLILLKNAGRKIHTLMKPKPRKTDSTGTGRTALQYMYIAIALVDTDHLSN